MRITQRPSVKIVASSEYAQLEAAASAVLSDGGLQPEEVFVGKVVGLRVRCSPSSPSMESPCVFSPHPCTSK